MKTITARDNYELPLQENDKVYQSLDELIADIKDELLEIEASGSVELGNEIFYLFESHPENWYIKLDDARFVEVTPKNVKQSKSTYALARKISSMILIDDNDFWEILKKENEKWNKQS